MLYKVEVNPEHTGQSGETEEKVIQKSSRGDISVKLPVKEGEGNQRKFISSVVEKSKPKWQPCKKKAELEKFHKDVNTILNASEE